MKNVVLEPLAPQMHVRKEAEKHRIIWHSARDLYTIIIGARRNDKAVVRKLQRQHTLLRRLLRKDQPNAGLVRGGMAIRRVMHLEDEVRSRRNKLRHAV